MKTLLIHLALAVAVATSLHAQASKLAPALQPFVDDGQLPGAVVLVADKDKVLAAESVGWADVESKREMRTDAVFWIASMTKPITSAALLVLVDEKRIDLDAAVARYLPEFQNQMLIVERSDDQLLLKKPKGPMLVRHLLSHTSGITRKLSVAGLPGNTLPLDVRVAAYAMQPLESEPGTQFHYTNGGFSVVGRLIEKVSGMPYADFLQKCLFDPLAMTETTFYPEDAQAARIPTGYRANKDRSALEPAPLDAIPLPMNDRRRTPFPGGGLFSTAADLAKFCQMVLNSGTVNGERILSPESVKRMTSRQTAEGIVESYGLGWTVTPDLISHAGAWRTNMTIHPREGLITIYLVQIAGWRDDKIGKQIESSFRATAIQHFGGRAGPSQPQR